MSDRDLTDIVLKALILLALKSRVFQLIEIFRIAFTAYGRNDHVTMFILHLPLAVFSLSKI